MITRTESNDAYANPTPDAPTRSYGVNGLNQYTSVAGTTHTYDLNSNLTSDGATSAYFTACRSPISGYAGRSFHVMPIAQKDGKRFLTKDYDSHSGGVWKVFDRTGSVRQTVDEFLKPIAE